MLTRITDARVWRAVKGLYLGAAILFIVNITIGVLNVFTQGEPTHAQILGHFHAGTIGWVTLSIIATALWAFTGSRTVSDGYARFTNLLAWVGGIAVLGYVASFWLAFSETGPYALLPMFGIPTALVIWGALGLAWANLKTQTVLTTAHLLLFGALLVVSLGALMGILWGLTYSTDIWPYMEGGEGIAAHAGPMDMYLALAFAAIVETLIRKEHHERWTKPGMAQMVMGAAAAVVISVAAFVGFFEVAPLAMLLFLLSFGFYFVRTGWRTFKVNPFGGGRAPAIFWGGLFFPAYIVLFVVAVMVYFIPGNDMPHALEVTFGHVTFVGMATNLLLAQHSTFTHGSSLARRLEPIAAWTLNLGLLLFLAGEFMAERKEGALIMAVGAILAVGIILARLWKAEPAHAPGQSHPHMES